MPSLHRLAACDQCGRQFDVSATPELAGLSVGEGFECSCGAQVTVPAGKAEDAAVVVCSSCGAPREGKEEGCNYCGSTFTLKELELDAICPRCMARVSRRGHFCHHCAVPLTAPVEGRSTTRLACPACSPPPGREEEGAGAEGGGGIGAGASTGERGEEKPGDRAPGRALRSRRIGRDDPLHLFECDACAGMWLDREVFTALVERAKRGRVALPGLAPASPEGRGGGDGHGAADSPGRWRYRSCAVCGTLMLRRNYGRRSGVILDLCGDHGLWFDADELHRVLVWVKSGGSTHAEADAAARAEAAKRKSPGTGSTPIAPFPSGGGYRRGLGEVTGSIVLEGIAWLVDSLVDTRWR